MLDATFELFQRDGIFGGLNLREVADRAGVNRGQIYQYFGDRASLLRAAVVRRRRDWMAGAPEHWNQPFTQRRRSMFASRLQDPSVTMLQAILAIDGNDEAGALPMLDRTREALEADQRAGEISPDIDAVALHVLMAAAEMGYVVFRRSFARVVGCSVEELDTRVLAIHGRVLDAITGPEPRPEKGASSHS